MSQTNGIEKTPPLSLVETLNFLERWKMENKPCPNVYKLHPDDFRELEKEANRHSLWPLEPWRENGNFYGGIEIISHPSAPRLPRKGE